MVSFSPLIIDAHAHLYSSISEIAGLVEIMDSAGLSAMNVACLPTGLWPCSDIHVNFASLLFKAWRPTQVYVFGGLDYTGKWASENGINFCGQARKLIEMGADGIKMIEGKPNVRQKLGIPLSSSTYEEFYALLEAESFPILFHIADPDEFWDSRRVPESARKCGCFYGERGYPSKQHIYREVEEILEKFSGLRIIFAHFCFLSLNMDGASRFLDRWPHIYFDITPGYEMYENFSKEPEKWREFFCKYQDRIIFGTDNSGGNGRVSQQSILEAMEKVRRIRSFLETDHPMYAGRGLNLPTDILEKIYAKNFQRIVGSRPRRLHLDVVLSECEKGIERIRDDGARAHIVSELEEIARRIMVMKEQGDYRQDTQETRLSRGG